MIMNMIKRIAIITLLLMPQLLQAQKIKDLINNAGNILNGSSLSNDEVVKGLKEALSIGSKNSADKASKTDGYFRNPLIKILMPPEAKQLDVTLRKLGAGKQVDAFVMQLNRAAEDAAKKAAPIFLDAILHMKLQDGLSILQGNDDAATRFLQNSTNSALVAAFAPVIKGSLDKVQITKYWTPLTSKYNKLPMVKKVNPDLTNYVTTRAIEGLFKLVAQEEAKIRKDPTAQVTDLLKKVFGKKG